MALNKSVLIKQELSPVSEMEVMEIPPLIKSGTTGKYVFLWDYQVTIYTNKAKMFMQGQPLGGSFELPKNSTYTLKYSKGDVVDVIAFGMSNNGGGVPVENKTLLVIKVPNYVKPITGFMEAFPATITIDNYNGWLQKVAETTPLTSKFGVDFGKNENPKTKPVYNNPVKQTQTPTPTPTGTTTTPVVTNGVQNTEETKGFFDDKNNLIMVGVILLVGYLLLDNKAE
jgi:hypothetical protein